VNIIELVFNEYYYLRQTIPIFLYIFYIHFRDVDHPIIESLLKTGLIAIGFLSTYSIAGFLSNISFSELIPFNWQYSGIITWGIFFLIYYYISNRKGLNELTAFTLATLATLSGGWLYEIPFYYPISMFLTHTSIFYFNSQPVCLLLLIYELKKNELKTKHDYLYYPFFIHNILNEPFFKWTQLEALNWRYL